MANAPWDSIATLRRGEEEIQSGTLASIAQQVGKLPKDSLGDYSVETEGEPYSNASGLLHDAVAENLVPATGHHD